MTDIATGPSYAPYIEAARQNITALLALATGCGDDEGAYHAQAMLDCFNDPASELEALIEAAAAPFSNESDLVSFPRGDELSRALNRTYMGGM